MTNDVPLPPAPKPASSDAMAKARAAMRSELTKPRPASWKANVAKASGTIIGLSLTVAGVMLLAGECSLESLSNRAVTLATLISVGVVTTWASLRPQGRVGRIASVGLVVLAAVLLVLMRGAGTPSDSPHWVCTVSHFAVGLAPAAVVIVLLRGMAPNRLRSIVAGLAAGTTGAFVGELACAKPAGHVAVFHLSAWVAVALVVTLVSSRLTPRSYAP
ncbi:MAG: NrsF family protein [Myxococcaceae bacterium]